MRVGGVAGCGAMRLVLVCELQTARGSGGRVGQAQQSQQGFACQRAAEDGATRCMLQAAAPFSCRLPPVFTHLIGCWRAAV